jgi:hypothetical protein
MTQAPVRCSLLLRYPLREPARAHSDLEARRMMGSTILIP